MKGKLMVRVEQATLNPAGIGWMQVRSEDLCGLDIAPRDTRTTP